MENPKSLATESFSFSWLADKKPQHSRDKNKNPSGKDFDFSLISSRTAPVHADEIFSGGQMKFCHQPRFLEGPKIRNSKSAPQSPVSSSRQFVSSGNQVLWLGKWGKSSRSFFRDIFGILNPVTGCTRKNNRVGDFERAQFEASPRPRPINSVVCNRKDVNYGLKKGKSCNNSPRIGPSSSTNTWSCESETSIHEAILYCKKSIEN